MYIHPLFFHSDFLFLVSESERAKVSCKKPIRLHNLQHNQTLHRGGKLFSRCFYRPQHSCGKEMFLRLSVSHSVHGGVSAGQNPPGQTPLGRHPTGHTDSPADGYCCGRYASYWNVFLFTYDVKLR